MLAAQAQVQVQVQAMPAVERHPGRTGVRTPKEPSWEADAG